MNNMKPEPAFPYDKNTLVVLVAKCPKGHAIIKRHGHHWIAKPLPKPLQDESLKDVFKGWLYLRSQLQQYRFVHVLNDRLFDVVFETKDSVTVYEPVMKQPTQLKGIANV